MTLAVDWLGRRARLSPHKLALIDTITSRRITYAQWDAQANQTAHTLADLGIGKGDRVCVLATNCVEYLDIWFACGKLGAILQNLNWRLAVRELSLLIRDATPRVLIYSADFIPQVNELRAEWAGLRYLALTDKAASGDLVFATRIRQPTTPPRLPHLTLDDPWVICYTGGTTGSPKGAILTHGNITWNAINTVMSWGLAPDDTALLNSPLFHTGGLNVFTAPLVHIGGTSVLCKGFDADQVFDLVDSRQISLLFGVPTMFIVLQQHPRWATTDFSHLKLVISGGAPCPLPVFERFWAKGIDFKTGYGLTEAGPNTFWLPREDVRRKPGAVGHPLFHVEVKLVDRDGEDIEASNTPGELLIRGPHRSPGYWNNPQATMDAIDTEGWLHTGDLAQRDDEGYYSIVGRVKDLIISGGENIYPAEVESILHSHPCVAEAALIPVSDVKWGEVGRAIVVLREGVTATENDVRDFCRERLAAYKVPKSVVFVRDIPKTGANKVDKQRLVEMYGSSSAQETP